MVCSTCKKDLDKSNFCKNKNTKSGLESRCRSCVSQKAKKWYLSNKTRQYSLARTPSIRFNYAKKKASERNLTWNIEKDKYFELIKLSCYYCSKEPDNTTTGVWLDRLDNRIGYEVFNVVPCCGPCNSGRNMNFTPEEWVVAMNAVVKFRSYNSA